VRETVNPADGAGFDLSIGGRGDTSLGVTGNIRAVVAWNRTPLHHEILATHRYYATRYGFTETLTNQPFSLVVASNSESTIPQGLGGPDGNTFGGTPNAEPGVFDRVATALGITLDSCFMLGLAQRSTSNMISDWATDVLPLVEYLQSLGVPPVVVQWDGINDGYIAANVATYQGLVAAAGAKFVTATSMARSSIGHSGPSDGTEISTYNIALLADGASNHYQVAGLGYDATLSTMAESDGTWDTTYLSDGTHWLTAAIVIAVPYFVDAIQAALTPPSGFPPTILLAPYFPIDW
jgi:hypothetical protein